VRPAEQAGWWFLFFLTDLRTQGYKSLGIELFSSALHLAENSVRRFICALASRPSKTRTLASEGISITPRKRSFLTPAFVREFDFKCCQRNSYEFRIGSID
jgi:hypothetical protein